MKTVDVSFATIESKSDGKTVSLSVTQGKPKRVSVDMQAKLVYERGGVKITGVHSFHDEARGAKRGDNVIFAVEAGGVILRLHVADGKAQELLAYGPPPAVRTADLRNESWFYWISPEKTIRLVWRGDKVRNVLNINE